MEKVKNTKETKKEAKKEVKEIEVVKEVKKTKKQIILELNTAKKEIKVEIMNVGIGGVSYYTKLGYPVFDLEPSETAIVSLEDMVGICKCRAYFRDGHIIITDVFSDDYSLEDIFMFLKLDLINADINYDQIGEILRYDDNEFEKALKGKDKKFIKNVASKGVYLNNKSDEDYELSRRKEKILCDKLGLDSLILE